ncbi:MAG: OB-fold domain-containing protein [Maritimibacter sp.]|nr:OB-fold domain-containing protein [Maritimibacter sp.]
MASPQYAWQAWLDQGRFRLQYCATCRRHVFHPRALCPHCGTPGLDWVDASGLGQVHSTTCVRRKPEAGGDYNIALIDLDEGPRMMSRVETVAPDAVGIGLRVRARVARTGSAPALLVFDPETAVRQAP